MNPYTMKTNDPQPRRTGHRWLAATAVGVAVTAAVFATGDVAAATGATSTATIAACYSASQQLAPLAIPHGSSCPTNYTKLTWNTTGPRGPQGPAGPKG